MIPNLKLPEEFRDENVILISVGVRHRKNYGKEQMACYKIWDLNALRDTKKTFPHAQKFWAVPNCKQPLLRPMDYWKIIVRVLR